MPTKAELETKIEALENDLRRTERALGQARLEIEDLPSVAYNQFIAPHTSEEAREALKRANAEWNLNVVDPSSGNRITMYIKSSHGLKWSWEARLR